MHRTGIDDAGGGAAEDRSAMVSISVLIEQLTGLVRRQSRVFAIVPAAAIALGLLYLLIAPSQYTATATLLIDSSKLRVLQNQLQPQGDPPLDTGQVGSQVEILRSDKIALAVIRELGLDENPEFVSRGAFSWISTLFRPAVSDASAKAEKEQKALDEFGGHRGITWVRGTYAMEIAFRSLSPVTAAKVANAIAEAYINDQLEAKDLTQRASEWLQGRINQLKAEATAADRAVLEFKEKNNIVDFGGANGVAAPGGTSRLMGEQQLFDLNTQLSTARAATSEAKARLERIEQVRKLDVSEATVTDSFRNEVITRLRNQYLDLSAREANWSARYGRDHLAAINLRAQMEELRRNIGEELGRIAASYQSDYEIAKAREENLNQALASLVTEGQVTNRDRLGLAELESSAKIYHGIYDNFLQHYMEAIQQQSFPITDARVISAAAPPTQKSGPVGSLVLTIAATMGLILSFALASLREAIDGVFRTALQAEQALRVKCLSVIPMLTTRPVAASATEQPVTRRARPYADAWRGPKQQVDESATPKAASFGFTDPLLRRVVDEPLSVFAEALRAIKLTAEFQAAIRNNKVIGITSTLANEGKSTIACNLAALMADAGKRVILLDADLRNPMLIRSLSPSPTAGLMELLTGKIDLQQAIGREPDTGLALLPLLLSEPLVHCDEILSSQAFRDLIDQLGQRYDYVIMDLPPIAPVVDVRATVPVVDSFVFVVEWGTTKINTVQRHLMEEPELFSRLLGVVLNKADLRMLERFDRQAPQRNGYYASHLDPHVNAAG